MGRRQAGTPHFCVSDDAKMGDRGRRAVVAGGSGGGKYHGGVTARAITGRTDRMSAQRRTAGTTKRNAAAESPGAAAPPRPVRPAEAATAPRAQRPASERGRAGAPERRSVLADRTQGIRKLYSDTRAEMRKISWPDRETTRNLTIVVIAISVALGLLLGGIDFILFQIFQALT